MQRSKSGNRIGRRALQCVWAVGGGWGWGEEDWNHYPCPGMGGGGSRGFLASLCIIAELSEQTSHLGAQCPWPGSSWVLGLLLACKGKEAACKPSPGTRTLTPTPERPPNSPAPPSPTPFLITAPFPLPRLPTKAPAFSDGNLKIWTAITGYFLAITGYFLLIWACQVRCKPQMQAMCVI